MRLINAEHLAKFIDYGHLNNPNEKLYSENDIREMIDMMPTIDAVPVVRCEQCTWRNMGECMFWAGEGMYTEDNDYCSRGKRREE